MKKQNSKKKGGMDDYGIVLLEDIQSQFGTFLEAFGVLNDKVTGLELRFDKLENRFDTLENRFDTLENRFDTLESRFDTLESRFDTLESRFDTLESRFDKLEEKVDVGFAQTNTRFKAIETKLDSIEARLDNVEASLKTSLEYMMHADDGIQIARKDIDHLKQRALNPKETTKLLNLEDRVMKIEKKLTLRAV